MAQQFLSPGVFTRERDLSFLPQGIAQIGAAFIGPTLKGPAFRPVIVQSQQDFLNRFGGTSINFYTPYAVRNYLKEAATATIVRVLGLSGYDNNVTKGLVLSVSGSGGQYVLSYLHPSIVGVTLPTGSVGTQLTPTQFTLIVSSALGTTTFNSLSINTTSPNYFASVLGTNANTSKGAYSYADFPSAANFVTGSSAGSGSVVLTQAAGELMLSGSTYGTYNTSHTPFIRSQLFGNTRYDLFQFFSLGDGNSANADVKISVANIRPDPNGSFGTFSILVRSFTDTDASPTILEQFDGLVLDPTSPNYVARRIGTARPMIDSNGDVFLEGEFPNNSQYVFISMVTSIATVPVTSLPYGFEPLATPLNVTNLAGPAYVTTRYAVPAGATTAVPNDRQYYGYNYLDETALSYLNPTPSGSVDANGNVLRVGVYPSGSATVPNGGADTGFDLLTNLAAQDTIDIAVSTATTIRKFTVPLQGGFDGQNPAVARFTGASILGSNTMGFDLSDSSKDGARAYAQAILSISNPDSWDINMLVLPGVLYSLHPYVATLGMNLVNETTGRGDAFYIMDPDVLGATVSSVTNAIQGLDTNYTGVYHPWVKIFDSDNNQNVWVPPSVVMAGIYAFNDRVGAEWFAPAGLNRGGISAALQVRTRLSQSDRDTLYLGRVNPIAQFPAQGIVAWGQKTLQVKSSAEDRINVRRLLISVKKFIASTSRYLVFEQNVDATRQRFLSIVNPFLASIQERSGLFAFKVVMDSSNNTPDLIDRNILVGDLFLKPTRTAEFIKLTFNVLPTGATFPTA